MCMCMWWARKVHEGWLHGGQEKRGKQDGKKKRISIFLLVCLFARPKQGRARGPSTEEREVHRHYIRRGNQAVFICTIELFCFFLVFTQDMRGVAGEESDFIGV